VAAPSVLAPPVEAQAWVMPDYRGQNLQAAQDAIQALTGNPGFFSTSSDLTGQGRMQVMDRNWQVCSSTPAPGETFTAGSSVDFGVVKLDSESCP
jgi:beta-lactam-binding protein with PASTA domain